jgi:hypothetical protein
MIFRNVRIFMRTLMRFLRKEISEALWLGSSYPFEKWTKGLRFQERGGTLHMRSVYSAYPFGLIWVAGLVAGLVVGIGNGVIDLSWLSNFWNVIGIAALGFAGLVMLTIRSIDTSFDPTNGTILYRRSLFSVVWHRDCLPLAETSGVLFEPIEPYVDEGGCLYLVLKDVSFRRLTHHNGSAALERAIEAIHAATGLTRIADA